jgi:hypothetical protein
VDVSLRSLFEDPTVAGLSLEIQKALDSGVRPRAPLITRITPSPRRERLLAKLERLSEEQVSHLLKNMVANRKK